MSTMPTRKNPPPSLPSKTLLEDFLKAEAPAPEAMISVSYMPSRKSYRKIFDLVVGHESMRAIAFAISEESQKYLTDNKVEGGTFKISIIQTPGVGSSIRSKHFIEPAEGK